MTRSDYLIPIIPSLLLALARLSSEIRCWLRGDEVESPPRCGS